MRTTLDEDEKLLIASMADTPYSLLLHILQDVDFTIRKQRKHDDDDSNAVCRKLHPELAERVADFLTIRPVVPEEVQVVGCSSSDGAHPLSACLSPDEDSWWISAADSMPEGKGREFVEFELSETLCRLSSVSLKIPPLPAGPLSVRDFVLEAPMKRNKKALEEWEIVSPVFRVQNQSGMQQFFLEPPGLDVDRVRVVCLSNQLSDFYNGQVFGFTYQRVGYFAIRFE